jgi:hypothetical protein
MAKQVTSTGAYNVAAFGQNGFRVITSGGGNVEGEVYVAIQALADATFSATAESGTSPSSLAIPSGSVVYGNFSTVTVTIGTVLAYIG